MYASDILDSQGRPIWRDDKPVFEEIATVERDINRVFFGAVLTNQDETLLSRGGGKGLKIYDELKKDAHAGALLSKRKLAVTSRPWKVEPASDRRLDKKAAELVEAAFKALRFNHIRKRLLEATLKGYSVSEVIWEQRNGLVLPAAVKAKDPRRFVFGKDDSLRLRTPAQMVEGVELPSRKFIVHRRGADDDSPYGTGIGGMLFWPVFFKRQGISFWLTFADKFGSPTAVGKYPRGSSKPEQDKLLAALRALSQDAGVIVPDGMLIELLEAERSGSVDTYEKLVRYMDESMSKAVLGETMSTTAAGAGLGSNQASVHNDVRLEVAKDDADELDETLDDTLVKWIVEFNLPGAGLPHLQTDFSEPEDLAKRATRDKTITEMGFEPTDDYMLETYGEGWVRKAPVQPVVPDATLLPGVGTAGDPAAGSQVAFADGDGKPMQQARGLHAARQAALIDGAEQLAAAHRQVLMKQPVKDLLSMLDETRDLVRFRDGLGALLDAEPDPAVVDAIARATFAANIVGRGQAAEKKGFGQKLANLVARLKG